MEFTFEGKVVLTLSHNKGDKSSKHVSTDINLFVGKGLKKDQYLDEEDLPTEEGTRSLTQCFVQGLVGNIHQGHEKGYWDSAEHLRYIISELERGFVTVANVSTSNF